jgi:3-methyladenine DNA glycosylase AlkC
MKNLSRGEHNVPDSKARTEPTPSAFKDFFNRKLVEEMAHHLHRAWPGFDKKAFTAAALHNFSALELKQRAHQIAAALSARLPADVPKGAAHRDRRVAAACSGRRTPS